MRGSRVRRDQGMFNLVDDTTSVNVTKVQRIDFVTRRPMLLVRTKVREREVEKIVRKGCVLDLKRREMELLFIEWMCKVRGIYIFFN